MKIKETIYRFLLMLSNRAGYNLSISRKPVIPAMAFSEYFEDGLISKHSNEFLKDEKFIKAYQRGIKAANGNDYKWYWRVHVGLWAAFTCSTVEGDYVECGVGNGFLSSAILDYLNWNELDKNFYLFDTFEGIDERYLTPEEREHMGDIKSFNDEMRKVVYNKNYQSVENNFREWNRIYLIKGAIPETLNTAPVKKVAYLHIDMNCVIPEIAAIEHFYPKLSTGSIILLDDYANNACAQQKKAMDEWAEKMGVHILSLPTGQGMVVKTGAESLR